MSDARKVSPSPRPTTSGLILRTATIRSSIPIVEASRDSVRIGIEAPRQVSVHRYEVYEQIVRENEAARSVDAVAEPGTPAPVSALSALRHRDRR